AAPDRDYPSTSSEEAPTKMRVRASNRIHSPARTITMAALTVGFGRDVRHTLRMMGRNPGFTAVAILSLALGLGANAAIFRFVDAVLLQSLPVSDPGRLVLLRSKHGTVFNYPFFRELAQRSDAFVDLAARWVVRVNLTADGQAQHLEAELVSGTYFRTLGVRPAL